jgi:hypothetical protein
MNYKIHLHEIKYLEKNIYVHFNPEKTNVHLIFNPCIKDSD